MERPDRGDPAVDFVGFREGVFGPFWNRQDVVAEGTQSALLFLEGAVRSLGVVGDRVGGIADILE